jgi:hypothetical protein
MGRDVGRGLGVARHFPLLPVDVLHTFVFYLVYALLADVGTKIFGRFGKRGASFCGRKKVKSLEWNRATLLQKGMNPGVVCSLAVNSVCYAFSSG